MVEVSGAAPESYKFPRAGLFVIDAGSPPFIALCLLCHALALLRLPLHRVRNRHRLFLWLTRFNLFLDVLLERSLRLTFD